VALTRGSRVPKGRIAFATIGIVQRRGPGKLVEKQLTPNDWLKNKSGVVRWKNRVAWRRFRLVQMGLLKPNSPRGIWEISDRGRRALDSGEIEYPDD